MLAHFISLSFPLQMIGTIRHILDVKRWWDLPRYALGSSSGGCTALELALRFPLQACAAYNPMPKALGAL